MSHQSHLHRRVSQDIMNKTPVGVIRMQLGTELQLNLDSASRHSHSPRECTIRTRHRDETISITHTNVRSTNTRHPLMSTQQTQNELTIKKKKKKTTNQPDKVVTDSLPFGSALGQSQYACDQQAQLTPNQAC